MLINSSLLRFHLVSWVPCDLRKFFVPCQLSGCTARIAQALDSTKVNASTALGRAATTVHQKPGSNAHLHRLHRLFRRATSTRRLQIYIYNPCHRYATRLQLIFVRSSGDCCRAIGLHKGNCENSSFQGT